MPEMIIEDPIIEKDVIDYDFSFVGGMRLPVTVDESAGDTVTEYNDKWILDLTAKPSIADPDEILQAECVQVNKANLAVLIIRNRKQRLPSPEEQFNMKNTLHALAKGLQ